MNMKNIDRTAVVTGASSGIGRASAGAFAEAGFRVIAIARRADQLDELAASHANISSLAFDLTREGVAAEVVERVIAATGRIDVLLNAAGYGANAPSETVEPAAWDSLFAINLNAVAHLTAAALPHLLDAAQQRGVADVVTISSTAGLAAEPGAAAYSASKFAVRGLMEAWRKEFGGRDVRFSTIYPGAVMTEFGSDQQFIRDWYADAEERGAVATSDDIAEAVLFAVTRPARVAVAEMTVRPTRHV